MFPFSRRTLLIVLALCPAVLAGAWWIFVLDGLNPTAAHDRMKREHEMRDRRAWEDSIEAAREWQRAKRRSDTRDGKSSSSP